MKSNIATQVTDSHIEYKEEINRLLAEMQPYRVIFDCYAEPRLGSIIIRLNDEETRLVIEIPSHAEYSRGIEIERNGRIFSNEIYDQVRTVLQKHEEITDEPELARNATNHLMLYLINTGRLEDQQGFLDAFTQFIAELPTISPELQGYLQEIAAMNIDDIDIDTIDENDPQLKKLGELHRNMIASLTDTYREQGDRYIVGREGLEETKATEDDEIIGLVSPEFRNHYPEQSKRIERLFEILNRFEIENRLSIIDEIAGILGMPRETSEKLKSYFVARSKPRASDKKTIISDEVSPVLMLSEDYWYSDNDMGQLLRRFVERNFEGASSAEIERRYNTGLTFDQIGEYLRNLGDLEENKPIFIAYNIGGSGSNAIEGGVHWVAIVLVKHQGTIKVLYKDSKGDFNNNAADIEAEFRAHYGSAMEFIRHIGVEQKDGSSCGPMTIQNLEFMMNLAIQEGGANRLVESFRDIDFSRQDQVAQIRAQHAGIALQIVNTVEAQPEEDGIQTIEEIMNKLHLIDKDSSGARASDAISKPEITQAVEKIDEFYQSFKKWGVSEILAWSKEHKGKLAKDNPEEICKAIAIMERANELATHGHRLRDTQKAAIYIFMQTKDKGHISQINTGEGKTTIVSFVEALKVMQGYKGHVITSNGVLAEDGVKNKKTFYGLLGITVAHNNPEEGYTQGPGACYARDIVYGSINNFQFDWLRDSFERLETMKGVDFNNVWAMLDEIDSLLIDQGGNIAKLSGPFPGMESLRYVYINIWAALAEAEAETEKKIKQALQDEAKRLYDSQRTAQEANSDAEALDQLEGNNQKTIEELEDKLSEEFLKSIKDKIIARKDHLINKEIIARHLHTYVEQSIERWIEYAFAAKYQYTEDVEYKLVLQKDKDGKEGEYIIIPVDNQNTGVSMKNTILSNGLHQFLQIKHNLCLTYESLTSSYVSNLGYVTKYGGKLFGVTGTLGSDAERELLGAVFNLEFSIIPPYKEKIFQEFPGRIIEDEQFINGIAIAALAEVMRRDKNGEDKPRAVLIVCSSIRDVEEVRQEIHRESLAMGLEHQIKIYTDESEAHVTDEILDVGDIVIATNIAGRGTDFNTTPQLENNGGLHVIEAFLPCNQRVQDQGFGRTSRQGHHGTGQIIARLGELQGLGIEYISDTSSSAGYIENFEQNLQSMGIQVKNVSSDGNCFFHAVEAQLRLISDNGVPARDYQGLREVAIVYVRNNAGELENFIEGEDIEQYIDRISRDGAWVDNVLIEALSQQLGINIVIFQNNNIGHPIIIGNAHNQQTIFLGHITELHYVSLENIQSGRVKKEVKFAEEGNKYLENIHDTDEDSDDDAMAMTFSRSVFTIEADYFKKIIKERDRLEKERIEDIKANKLMELEFKDQLFNRFSSLYGRLKDQHKDDEDFKWSYVLNDLKEKWAFWLEEQNYTVEKIRDLAGEDISAKAKAAFEQFQEEAREIIVGSIRHNPYYGICLAERYLEIGDKANRDKAKIELDHALTVGNNSELLYSAHMKLFEVAIENGGQALERFKKAVAKVYFFSVDKDETYKAVALDQLKKARAALNKEYDYLTKLITGQESDETELNETDVYSVLDAILIQSSSEDPENQNKENIFLKHLQARLIVLGVYLNNIKSLLTQMGEVQDSIDGVQTLGEGIIIDAKVPRYLNKLDTKNENEKKLKEAITDRAVNELEYVGMSSVIQLKEIHDVPGEVITNSQWQIGGGLAALAITIPFPFLLPINGPIAGALIGEGITDIIMALIDQGQTEFDKKDYNKGKIISYAISIVTMGIGAIVSSTKILTKAMNACKNLASKLRAVEGPFAKVCQGIANKLDKIANYLELSIKKIEMVNKGVNAQKQMLVDIQKEASVAQKFNDVEKYNKLTKQLQQLDKLKKVSDIAVKHSQQLIQILKTTATGALKGVAMSVAMEKIFTAALNNIMAGLKPQIEEKVKVAVGEIINTEQARLAKYTQAKINEQIQAVFETSLNEDIEHVAKEISLGVLRHSNNWKMQLAVLALDSLISGIDIATCADKICSKFLAALPVLPEDALSYHHNYEQIISKLGVQISDMVYGKIVAITGKVVVTLPKALYRGYKQHKEKIADKQAVELMKQRIEAVNAAEKGATAQDMACAHNAVSATLGIDNEHLAHSAGLAMSTQGATKDDIKQMYTQNGINAKESSLAEAVNTLQVSNSDRAVVCLTKDGDSAGHAAPVTLENGQLMVTNGAKKTTLADYQNEHGYNGAATVIIPENVRAENLLAIRHQINCNRVAKIAHPIDFVGKGEGGKFGAPTKGFPAFNKQVLVGGQYDDQGNDRENLAMHHVVPKDIIKHEMTKLTNADFDDYYQKLDQPTKKKIDSWGPDNKRQALEEHLYYDPRIIRVGPANRPNDPGNDLDKDILGGKYDDVKRIWGDDNLNILKKIDEIGKLKLDQPLWKNRNVNGFVKYNKKQHYVDLYNDEYVYNLKKGKGEKKSNKGSTGHDKFGIIKEYWLNYQNTGISKILSSRAELASYTDLNSIKIAKTSFISQGDKRLEQLQAIVDMSNYSKELSEFILQPILLPQSDTVNHWVGLVINKYADNRLTITYLDSENQPAPFPLQNTLVNELQRLMPSLKVNFNQPLLETQRYNNCGPELVENFIYYLTGARATQEAAVYLHSLLYENSLLDSEFAAPQIAENNRLIAELSNQMRPIYYMPSGYITREFLFIYQSMLKIEGIDKTALFDIADNTFDQMQTPIQVQPEVAKVSFVEADKSHVVSVIASSSNDNTNKDPENSKKPNLGLAETMLNIRNGIEFVPVLSYFVKNILYPISKDILPAELANINLPEIHSSLLYVGHVGASYAGALALNIASPFKSAFEASSSYLSRIVVKEVVHNIASFDLSNNINMGGYCVANTAFHFTPELMQLYYFMNIGQLNYGSEIVGGLLKANSLTTIQRLTTASLECYNTYKQVHNLEEKTETKIENIIPYVSDAIALGSSIAVSYNPFFIIGNIVAMDISSKIILKAIPMEIKASFDLGLSCLGVTSDVSSSFTNMYDIYWKGIENEYSFKTYHACKALADSFVQFRQFNWLNKIHDFASDSSYYLDKIIDIIEVKKDEEAEADQNALSQEFTEEKAKHMFKYISKPGLDIKYELLKQVALGVMTDSEYQDKLQKINFAIDIGETRYDLCISSSIDTQGDSDTLNYNCYSKENDIIDHIITDGAKLIGLYNLYSE